MKKIIAVFLIFIFTFSGTFAYSPSLKDKKLLDKIYLKLDKTCEKSENKCEALKKKIDKVSYKYKKKERVYFLLTEISKYIGKKLEKENDLDIDLLLGLDNDNVTSKKLIDGNEYKTKKNVESHKIICTKVSDGDTIHFKKDGKDYVARLIGIDSPENTETRYGYTERLGNEAKNYLNNLILNKEIQIEYDSTQARTDKYGRHLIYIFYKGENINKKVIEEGLAKEYTYNKPYKYQKEFLEAQQKAKLEKKGIWGLQKEDQKKVIKHIEDHTDISGKNCYIKGNINSKGEKIYHMPGCRSYNRTKITPSKGERCFETPKEAENAGWRIAGNCN